MACNKDLALDQRQRDNVVGLVLILDAVKISCSRLRNLAADYVREKKILQANSKV
jgi:hypothetical protein